MKQSSFSPIIPSAGGHPPDQYIHVTGGEDEPPSVLNPGTHRPQRWAPTTALKGLYGFWTLWVIFVLVRSLPIDTHRLAKRLEEAGFSPAQVEAQLEVLTQMVNLSDLATRDDLRKLALRSKKELQLTEARLKSEVQKEIGTLEARLRKETQELEARLPKEIAESEARLRKEIAEKTAELEARLRTEVEKSELRVRAEIIQSQNRLTFRVAGLLLAQGALYLTLQKLFQLLP